MRLQLAALIVALAAFSGGSGLGRASAQEMIGPGSPIVWSSPVFPSSPASMGPGAMRMADAVPSFPYSYYAAFPNRARQYVPYGMVDSFPFHGSPYGLPNDRWSWSTLSGNSGPPRRYFYPPVR